MGKYSTSNTLNIECPNIELSEHHILAQNRTSNMSNITKNWTVCEHRTVRSKSMHLTSIWFCLGLMAKKTNELTHSLCTDWANISAIKHAKSRLNYPIWTIATCKALVGDLDSTVKWSTYIKKLVGIFIFPWNLWHHNCLVLGGKTIKCPES